MHKYVIKHLLLGLMITLGLTACVGGGGGSGDTATETTTSERLDKIILLVEDNNQPADGSSRVQITAIARDANNQPLPDVALSLFSGSETAIFSAVNGVTNAQGVFTASITNTVEQSFEVVASHNSIQSEAVIVTFINPVLTDVDARIDSVQLIVNNNFALANGLEQIELIVVARDIGNSPVPSAEVSLFSTSFTASIAAIRGTTGDDGRFVTTVVSNTTEEFKITPTAGGQQGAAVDIVFIAPLGAIRLNADSSVVAVEGSATLTAEFVADSPSTPLLSADLLPDTPFTVSVSGNAQLSDVPARSDANGLATFNVSNNVGESVVVTVKSASLTQTLNLYFGANLALQPVNVTAVGSTTLQALLKDANNAPLPDQVISFGFAGTNNETLSTAQATTSSNGIASVTVEDVSQDGGSATVTAQIGQLTAAANVNFVAAFGDNRQLSVSSSSQVAALNQAVTITARITDAAGLPVNGQRVQFSAQTQDGTASQVSISPTTGVSNAQGEVQATVRSSGGEDTRITVSADLATQTVDLYFGAQLRLLPQTSTGIADGETGVALTAFLENFQRQGIAGIPLEFGTDGAALLDSFRLVSDASGQAVVNAINSTPQTVNITAQAGLLQPNATTQIRFEASGAANMLLSSAADTLALNSSTVITALVTDSQGNPVQDGTLINFSVAGPGVINSTALTLRGQATVAFNATTEAGISTITASSDAASANLTLTVEASEAGIIELSQIEPTTIGIQGSGVAQSTRIDFLVKDNLGNIVADGTQVDFSLGQTTLGGGETISTAGAEGQTASAVTNEGRVSVTLKSGTVAGTVDVIASVTNSLGATASAVARVLIVGTLPAANRMSLAVQYLNIAGGRQLGLQNRVTAYLADRFGNIVPDGTAVSFITEGGTIGTSIGGGAFTATSELGRATATLQSAAPSAPNLGGIGTLRTDGYRCVPPYRQVQTDVDRPETLCGNPGFTTIVAYTTGSEVFTDTNGNGVHDAGEPFVDSREPFIDGNDNNQFDAGELYIDVNNDGAFTLGNGVFDGPGGTNPNTTIWVSGRVLFSDEMATPTVSPPRFDLAGDQTQEFLVSNVNDIYGNPLVGGTTIEVTSNRGVLGGTVDATLVDNLFADDSFVFTLSSEFEAGLSAPQTVGAAIEITLLSPTTESAPGSNGRISIIIPGTITLLPQETENSN